MKDKKTLEDISKKKPKKDKDKDKKGFWDKVWNKKKLDKRNTVAVLYLRENGIAEPMEVMSSRGFFHIENKTYHEIRDCIYTMSKDRYPLAIIPEWSITPLGNKSWYDKRPQEVISILQDHCMNGIRHSERVRSGERMGDTKLNMKNIIVIGIIVIVAIAVLMGYAG